MAATVTSGPLQPEGDKPEGYMHFIRGRELLSESRRPGHGLGTLSVAQAPEDQTIALEYSLAGAAEGRGDGGWEARRLSDCES